jgi:hypothetical protein
MWVVVAIVLVPVAILAGMIAFPIKAPPPLNSISVDRWVAVALPRIIALALLNRVGIHAFDGLPTLAFAVAPDNPGKLTTVYSFRLMRAFGTQGYAADLRNAQTPLAVLVGAMDELFDAEKFAPTVHAVRSDVPVTIVPELSHIAMTIDPCALPAITAAIRGAP